MSFQTQYWVVRQNPYGETNQSQMKDFNIRHQVLTCPFGHAHEYASVIQNGEYNVSHVKWSSDGQDKQFCHDIQVGDIVIVPYRGSRKILIVQIDSAIKHSNFSDMFVVHDSSGAVCITDNPSATARTELFGPIYRDITVLKDITVPKYFDMRKWGMKSLSQIRDRDIIRQINNWIE